MRSSSIGVAIRRILIRAVIWPNVCAGSRMPFLWQPSFARALDRHWASLLSGWGFGAPIGTRTRFPRHINPKLWPLDHGVLLDRSIDPCLAWFYQLWYWPFCKKQHYRCTAVFFKCKYCAAAQKRLQITRLSHALKACAKLEITGPRSWYIISVRVHEWVVKTINYGCLTQDVFGCHCYRISVFYFLLSLWGMLGEPLYLIVFNLCLNPRRGNWWYFAWSVRPSSSLAVDSSFLLLLLILSPTLSRYSISISCVLP